MNLLLFFDFIENNMAESMRIQVSWQQAQKFSLTRERSTL